MKKNILFVCKYNRFRSQVAEAYFNKIKKNKNIEVKSVGILQVNKSLSSEEKIRNEYIKEKFGLKLTAKSRSLDVTSLLKANRIIVVANDIPKIIFDNKKWKDKVIIWSIPNESGSNKKNIYKIVKNIIKKVELLNKQLEKKLK